MPSLADERLLSVCLTRSSLATSSLLEPVRYGSYIKVRMKVQKDLELSTRVTNRSTAEATELISPLTAITMLPVWLKSQFSIGALKDHELEVIRARGA